MFQTLATLPADPLLGIMEKFRRDARPQKIDLGVGVYKDEAGQTPVLACVKAAERQLLDRQQSKTYLGPLGDQVFTREINRLALGGDNALLRDERVAALQTPGGCGALRVAAELIVRARPQATVWVSDPTWANHVPLLGSAGLVIREYPYYDFAHKTIRFEAMLDTLKQAPRGDLVLLHGCCHNPCGADLRPEQWRQVAALLCERGLIPFVDLAYQGFGEGLEEDAFGLREVLRQVPEAVYTVSCSKNFGLYRDRVGLVGFVAESRAQQAAVLSNLTHIVRGIYSMPPDHGAAVVSVILQDAALTHSWRLELAQMRGRIQAMREALAAAMRARGLGPRFDFVPGEYGMFSFLGITPEQVETLARDHAIYMAGSSRINVAGLCPANLEYFGDALATVLAQP